MSQEGHEGGREGVTLPAGRFAGFRRVLESLLAGRFEAELLRIVPTVEDEFAELEAMLQIFAEEYVEALGQNERLSRERQETIERQRAEIALLATPILDIGEDIVALPIVGAIDAARSQQMTQKLLSRIVSARARCVIVDVTGADGLDTSTANQLVRMIRAVKMLGSQCIVTGITAEIARTLVELDIDLGGARTLRSLKDALDEAFRLTAERATGNPEES